MRITTLCWFFPSLSSPKAQKNKHKLPLGKQFWERAQLGQKKWGDSKGCQVTIFGVQVSTLHENCDTSSPLCVVYGEHGCEAARRRGALAFAVCGGEGAERQIQPLSPWQTFSGKHPETFYWVMGAGLSSPANSRGRRSEWKGDSFPGSGER